jgi:hypothetical protein
VQSFKFEMWGPTSASFSGYVSGRVVVRPQDVLTVVQQPGIAAGDDGVVSILGPVYDGDGRAAESAIIASSLGVVTDYAAARAVATTEAQAKFYVRLTHR